MKRDTPLWHPAESLDFAAPQAAHRFGILVVDDQPGEILVMNQLLSGQYQVLRALSGAQALRIAQSQRPDLILLDVNMPGMDGFDVLQALRNTPRTASIPVIFITAANHTDDEARCLSQGAEDFISKPISPPVLLARVRTQLRLKSAHDELRRSEERLRLWASVFAYTREGVVITDTQWHIVETNAAFSKITGYTIDDARGRDLHDLLHLEHEQGRASIQDQVLLAGFWSAEIHARDKAGQAFPKLATISVARDPFGVVTHFINVFTDITLIKQQQQRLERMAHYDPLTDVPNRTLLAARLEQAVGLTQSQGHSFAVVYIDLDGFKEINDRHGHAMGDLVLRELAARLRRGLREGDTLARIGGDEFVIVLDTTGSLHTIEPFMDKIGALIRQPMLIAGQEIHVCASMGVTHFPDDQVEPEQLLRHADQAMYEAKRAGKATYHVFNARAEDAITQRAGLLARFKQALDDEELVLFYQPKVELRSGRVLGVEALLRWRHPELGLLGPDAFLPAVQGTPSGLRLGYWVIEAALRQLAGWREQGLQLSASVNIDAHHLLADGFLPLLERVVAATPWLEPGALEFEILESSAVADPPAISRVMKRCMELGIEFALDDFGRAYSTLDHLRHLPAREVKIDRSFVRDLGSDADSEAMIRGIVGLVEAFGRHAVAEGIETVAQGEALIRLGCTCGQGYLIARPMPAGDVPGWVAAWRPPAAWR